MGDWIIYYEPRRVSVNLSSRGGLQSYFAVARVDNILPDANKADHFYAYVSGYLEFDFPVPFKQMDRYLESAIQREDGNTNKGAFGRAVRNIPEQEFDLILQAGFSKVIDYLQPKYDGDRGIGFADEESSYTRPIIETVVRRPFRDAAFSASIKKLYQDTCAMTGLKLINGGGRSEVQAAHIKPVASSGPDSVRNGLALSGTMHWMFDRGLVSVADNFEILISKSGVPQNVTRMLNESGRLLIPDDTSFAPHPTFLRFHRENVFKG